MRIFVLDDMEDRLKFFRKWYGHHDYTETNKTWPAIAVLRDHPRFDIYFLDHDLEDEPSGMYGGYGSHQGDGHDVCQFIVSELPVDKRPRAVVVHSWNPDGAKRMAQTLADAGIKVYLNPFKPGIKFMDPDEI